MKITTVIFDFFGVISSEVAPLWFGERFSEEQAGLLKEKYMSPADRGDIGEEELFDNLSKLSGEPAEKIERDFMNLAVINREITELAEALGKKHKIALLSNAEAAWLHKILTKNDLYRLFDTMVISGEVRVSKPDWKIFEILLSRAGISADEAVFIDDNPKNVEAARTLGIDGIVFEGIDRLRAELSSRKIEY